MARNCIELLSTVLSSSPHQDALEDDLITTLAQQCRESQSTVVRIIETAGDNESLLFEALNVNDEIQKALSKYEELKPPVGTPHASHGGSNHDMMDDLFGKKGGARPKGREIQRSKAPKGDLITF
ncbi:hypothetical protein HRI_002211400 [Hibiscus trionum]|uniref:GAT domain-containing protein n=1 Tax=Hibiscus trionum TaxID=183268 RepID=A0A9W7HYL6_HIBTR|nr:hypothetical protein HRI_002211400 [Hibiscus trionum]